MLDPLHQKTPIDLVASDLGGGDLRSRVHPELRGLGASRRELATLDGVDAARADELATLDGEVVDLEAHAQETLLSVVALGDLHRAALDDAAQAGVPGVGDGVEECVEVLEIVLDRADAHTRFASHLANGELWAPFFAHERACGVEDLVVGIGFGHRWRPEHTGSGSARVR